MKHAGFLIVMTVFLSGPLIQAKDFSVEGPSFGVYDYCFSPDEACDQKVIQFIGSVKKTLDIAIYGLTHTEIANMIVDTQKRSGVTVRIVVDRLQAAGNSSLVPSIKKRGIQVRIGNFTGLMHDKYAIVDGNYLETGSYNYTQGATNKNAENQLYINDPTIVSAYQKNFEKIWDDAIQ